MKPFRPLLPALAAALLLSGCAFGPGEPYAVLAPSLDARLVTAPGRDAGDGWQRLSSDYQVRFTALRLETTAITLLDGGPPTELSFNPAQPPPGYSLCHAGHCHKDDGTLPTYEEIEAEISGRDVAPNALAELPTGPLDLLAGASLALSCEPGCELGAARIARASLPVTKLLVEGTIRDGRAEPRLEGEVPLRFEAAANPLLTLSWTLDVPADRREPPHVDLRLDLHLTAALLDGIAFEQLQQQSGTLDLGAQENAGARDRLLRNLAELELGAAVERAE